MDPHRRTLAEGEPDAVEQAGGDAVGPTARALAAAAARDALTVQGATVVATMETEPASLFAGFGMSQNGGRMYFVEAADADTPIGPPTLPGPDGAPCAMGTAPYFAAKFRACPALQQYLHERPELARALADGAVSITYQMVEIPRPGGRPQLLTYDVDATAPA